MAFYYGYVTVPIRSMDHGIVFVVEDGGRGEPGWLETARAKHILRG